MHTITRYTGGGFLGRRILPVDFWNLGADFGAGGGEASPVLMGGRSREGEEERGHEGFRHGADRPGP
jgi:hypothetical protein